MTESKTIAEDMEEVMVRIEIEVVKDVHVEVVCMVIHMITTLILVQISKHVTRITKRWPPLLI